MPININSHPELEDRIDSFRRKATDISTYVASHKWERLTVSVNRTDENNPNIKGNIPNDLILEGLYRRFRFFILNKEKSNYFRLLRLLSSSANSSLLHSYLRMSKKEFLSEDSLKFAFITAKTKYHPEEIINLWFNSYYFHDQKAEREKLSIFRDIVSDNGAKVVLFHAVWNAILKIRNLNYLIRNTSIERQSMYVPYLCKI